MSQDKRIQIEAMRRAGLIDQEEYNEIMGALDINDSELVEGSPEMLRLSPTVESRDIVDKYTRWKKSVDQHLLTAVGYNLAQSKLMVPSLENTTGDMYRAGDSPEDASLVIISTIEDNQ